jgi:small neutral amino acid transporter SnatA (MarC family)
LVGDKSPRERVRLAWQAAGVSLFVIASFALFGRFILDYMNVSIEALQAAGGLLLLYVALQLLTEIRTPAQNLPATILGWFRLEPHFLLVLVRLWRR